MMTPRKTHKQSLAVAEISDGGSKSNDMVVETLPITAIKYRPKETRKISDRAIATSNAILTQFGQPMPGIIEEDGTIVSGQEFVLADRQFGWTSFKVVRLSQLSKEHARVLSIGLVRLPQLSSWDDEILRLELAELGSLDLDFDLADTVGFNEAELDVVLEGNHADDLPNPLDDLPPSPTEDETITQTGDQWFLGENSIVCTNALAPETYENLLEDKKVRQILTDPPYNVPIEGNVSGLGKVKHKNFAMAIGECRLSSSSFFRKTYLTLADYYLTDGGLAYVFMDRRKPEELFAAAREATYTIVDLEIWDKGSGGMGSFLRSQHEPCLILKSGTAPHLNNVELGRHGRYRTNVWAHRGLSSFGRGRDDALKAHPTVKPVNLLAEAIKDSTRRGEIVLDPFLGSGSTLLAAEKTGRRC